MIFEFYENETTIFKSPLYFRLSESTPHATTPPPSYSWLGPQKQPQKQPQKPPKTTTISQSTNSFYFNCDKNILTSPDITNTSHNNDISSNNLAVPKNNVQKSVLLPLKPTTTVTTSNKQSEKVTVTNNELPSPVTQVSSDHKNLDEFRKSSAIDLFCSAEQEEQVLCSLGLNKEQEHFVISEAELQAANQVFVIFLRAGV